MLLCTDQPSYFPEQKQWLTVLRCDAMCCAVCPSSLLGCTYFIVHFSALLTAYFLRWGLNTRRIIWFDAKISLTVVDKHVKMYRSSLGYSKYSAPTHLISLQSRSDNNSHHFIKKKKDNNSHQFTQRKKKRIILTKYFIIVRL